MNKFSAELNKHIVVVYKVAAVTRWSCTSAGIRVLGVGKHSTFKRRDSAYKFWMQPLDLTESVEDGAARGRETFVDIEANRLCLVFAGYHEITFCIPMAELHNNASFDKGRRSWFRA